MNIAANARGFIERHIVSDIPAHLRDLFDHDEATHTGRLVAFALMLVSANVALLPMKLLLP